MENEYLDTRWSSVMPSICIIMFLVELTTMVLQTVVYKVTNSI